MPVQFDRAGSLSDGHVPESRDVKESTLTLGIDLAAADGDTAACVIRWEDAGGVTTTLGSGWSNAGLRELIAEADWTGIDTPFSWPVRFRRALAQHGRAGGWPADYRSPHFQFRTTDLFVKEIAYRPLSVSTNLLDVTAMRCARLLQEVGEERGRPISLAGDDRIVEVYPAATLVAWGGATAGFSPNGYKDRSVGKAAGTKARAKVIAALTAETEPWLVLPETEQQKCLASDNELDALIAALTTRTAQLSMTRKPTNDHQRRLAGIEGWIHVPEPGSLPLLGAAQAAE